MNWFKSKSSSEVDRQLSDQAIATFSSNYPRFCVVETTITGEEKGCKYVAVIYKAELPARPLPYKLFRISEEDVIEVDVASNPQFAIKGRK